MSDKRSGDNRPLDISQGFFGKVASERTIKDGADVDISLCTINSSFITAISKASMISKWISSRSHKDSLRSISSHTISLSSSSPFSFVSRHL